MTAGRRTFLRMLLAVVVLATALELLSRAFMPDPYGPTRIRLPGRDDVPISEIVGFMRKARAASQLEVPRGMLPANLEYRICYDRPTHDYFDDDGCVTVRINALGFRDDEFSAKKPEGEFRVLAIGDSFTFGLGVQHEDTWTHVLEGMLSRQRAAQVINGGFAAGSHYPPGYVGWFQRHAVALEPDVVILGLCLNDLGDVPMLWYDEPTVEPGISTFVTWVRTALARRDARATPVDVERYLETEQLTEVTGAVRTIRQVCADAGIRFVVVLLPMLSRLDDYPYDGLHEAVRDLCAKLGIEHVDLLERFRGRDEAELWVHPTDQHANDIGNRLIAEGIRDFLKQPR